jgi:hypothetical protein
VKSQIGSYTDFLNDRVAKYEIHLQAMERKRDAWEKYAIEMRNAYVETACKLDFASAEAVGERIKAALQRSGLWEIREDNIDE